MGGTKSGGVKAAQTNKAKWGEDFYQRIGAIGGKSWDKNTSPPRGFLAMPKEKVAEAGRKGGTISRRGKA